jgi:hypothetical protein
MADDQTRLIVSLEASITKFERAMSKAQGVANDRTSAIEKRFNSANVNMAKSMSQFAIAAGNNRKAGDNMIAGMSSVSAGMSKTAKGAGEVSHAIGAMSTQGMAAFHALRGGGEMLAQGVSPMRVLAMEMNNITYAASGSGGLKGAFGEAIGVFTKMLNPVTILAGGLATLGVAATAAAVSYANAQARIKLALTGVGAAGGVTVDAINRISEATASAGEVSVSEARDFAAAIAAMGQTSVAVTGQATALAKAYSLVFGEDLQQSAKDLGAALADPAKGVDTINAKLLAFDHTTSTYIHRVAAQG